MIDGIEKTNGSQPALVYEGTTYVPIRFIGEAFGKQVEWNGETDTQSNVGSIDYNLEGKYTRLTGLTGIDDKTKNSDATGTFKVIGDGLELATYSGLRGGDLPRDVEVDVTGVSKLQLIFESDNVDRITIDFVEAKLFY